MACVIAFLAMAPLDKSGDVSFILDKNQVENAPERMRVEQARYVGEDNRGPEVPDRRQSGDPAHHPSMPVVDIRGMLAQFGLAQGPVTVAANQGRYNIDEQKVDDPGSGARCRARRRAARDPRRHRRLEAATP